MDHAASAGEDKKTSAQTNLPRRPGRGPCRSQGRRFHLRGKERHPRQPAGRPHQARASTPPSAATPTSSCSGSGSRRDLQADVGDIAGMRASLGCYACKTCGSQFEAPISETLPMANSCFTSRPMAGLPIWTLFLAAFGELGFSSIGRSESPWPNDRDRSDLFQKMYGLVACDPDEAGCSSRSDTHGARHGSRRWRPGTSSGPLRMSGDIPAVTHRKWDSLDAEEKRMLLPAGSVSTPDTQPCEAGLPPISPAPASSTSLLPMNRSA